MARAIAIVAAIATTSVAVAAPLGPPKYPARPTTRTVHGEALVDDYPWLEKRALALPTMRAENAYTAAALAPTAALQKQIVKDLNAYHGAPFDLPGTRLRAWEYIERHRPELDYPVRVRRSLDGKTEQVLLDLNREKSPTGFLADGDWEVSFDDRLYAYTIDNTGGEAWTLYIKQIADGKLVDQPIKDVTDFVFASNEVLLYAVAEPTTRRSYRVYRHKLGTPSARDKLVYEERDPAFSVDLDLTLSDEYVILNSSTARSCEIRLLPRAAIDGPWELIVPRRPNVAAYLEHRGANFYVRSNAGSVEFRVFTSPVVVEPGTERQWRPIAVPLNVNTQIEDLFVYEHFTALHVIDNMQSSIQFLDENDQPLRSITMADPIHEIELTRGLDYHATTIRYDLETPILPMRVIEIDPLTGASTTIFTAPIPGFDSTKYQTERLFIPSHDRVAVPVTLIYRRDLSLDTPQPMFMLGYGAYGTPTTTGFGLAGLPYVDRGVIVARVHTRGGNELGTRWHIDGRQARKTNTFLDFIAVAEALIARGYTAPNKLAIDGGSAGGLLIAAVLNMRPDLFKVALLEMPFVDVVGTMLNEKLPLSVEERDEWGDPRIAADYRYMRSYSPYQNISKQPYPTIMVRTALNDSRVMYWEAAKYVARLRAHTTSPNPIYLRIDLDGGGHQGRSGKHTEIEDQADDDAFVLSQLGIK